MSGHEEASQQVSEGVPPDGARANEKLLESVSALAEKLGIHRTVLYHWKNHLKAIEGGTADSPIRELRKQVRDLKRVLAEKTLRWIFSKVPCKKSKLGARATAALAGRHLRPGRIRHG